GTAGWVGLLDLLDAFHGVIVKAEVVSELMAHGVSNELGHLFGVRAIFLDGAQIDVDRVGEDVLVRGVAAGLMATPLDAVERTGATLAIFSLYRRGSVRRARSPRVASCV